MNNKGLVITASLLFAVIIGLIMHLALWADDVAYKNAKVANDTQTYKDFLKQYPESEFADEIRVLYDECAYRDVVRVNTEKAYSEYLKEHPNSQYVDSARSLIEEFVYTRALTTPDASICRAFLDDYPDGEHAKMIQKRLDYLEREYYTKKINIEVDKIVRDNIYGYNRLFPNGKYSSKVSAKLAELNDYEAYTKAKSADTKYAWKSYIQDYPHGKYASIARAKIKEFEERDYYQNNSLSNGAQPYAKYYGSNYSYDWNRAAVKVNASAYSDVVVIVHYNNGQGRVAGHVYVRKGCSSTIYLLPNKTYQVFFYYGKGWYPKKEMSGGIKGGFLSSESFSKDGSSMYLRSGEIVTYTLTQQVNGNFSTSGSSKYEMF